jgi:hypothetical protein
MVKGANLQPRPTPSTDWPRVDPEGPFVEVKL